ncbi:MAG: T9SS C-terminal target domain-containing protein [Bacteroidetes bacterium]|nr:MAG: T9SS C-terminal target domain-containing protein [Bacteroidota bacterium]
MKKYPLLLVLFCLAIQTQIYSQRKVGTNLSSITDYSEELVFKDAFKAARQWIPFNSDGSGGWDSGVEIPLGIDGYPLEIPYDNGTDAPQAVRSLILWDLEPEAAMPMGTYTLKIKGTGEVRLDFGATGTFTSPGTYTFVPTGSNIAVSILSSDVNDPVHDIEVILPGYADDHETAPFHPEFLSFIDDFHVLRFMDWMRTNNSPVQVWAERTSVDNYTQAMPSGIAYEHIVDLCNTAKKDPWICIPHQADDDFITQMAHFLFDNLDQDLTVYLEYSNEVWNGIFAQNSYASQQGAALGYEGQPWEQAWQYTAKRSADVFYLFEQVFGTNTDRLVKIIPSQSVNSWLSNYIISRFEEPEYNPYGVEADVLAIAPYFGGGIGDQIGNDGLIESITVDEILNMVEASLEEDAFIPIASSLEVANDHELVLMTYEGGQHLVSYQYQSNETLTQKLTDANRHDRMEDIYCEYLNYWYLALGEETLFVNFSSQGSYSRYGSWGLKEYQGQPAEETPKYRAFQNCVFGTSASVQIDHKLTRINIVPNPANDVVEVMNTEGVKIKNVRFFDASGKRVLESLAGIQQFDLSSLQSGIYFVEILTEVGVSRQKLIKY